MIRCPDVPARLRRRRRRGSRLGKQSRVWIGTAAEMGHTTTRVPGRGFNYERLASLPPGLLPADGDATLVRWTLTGILGSNYSFLE